jgi:putative hydrolase of the HAD superfamily
MIRWVLFDIGNVLMPYDPSAFYKLLEEHSKTGLRSSHFLHGKIVEEYELGKINNREFYKRIAREFKLKDLPIEIFFYFLGRMLTPNIDMMVLKRRLLANKIKIACITNNNPFHVRVIHEEYPKVLEGVSYLFSSHDLGMRKPDANIFQHAVASVGAAFSECLLVDDMLENVCTFYDLGGNVFHFDVGRGEQKRNSANIIMTCNRFEQFLRSALLISPPEV